MATPDPEEDFDAFMESMPRSARNRVLQHMRGETEDEPEAPEPDLTALHLYEGLESLQRNQEPPEHLLSDWLPNDTDST